MGRGFYQKKLKMSYNKQGIIYFTCKNFESRTKQEQQKILRLCEKVCAANKEALWEYLCTDDSATTICLRHNIASATTLYRATRKFYRSWFG